jgi:hypothetical protein
MRLSASSPPGRLRRSIRPFTEGARLFVSVSNAGGMTTTPPPYPNYIQRVGIVTRAHATQGEILVLISGGVRDQHAPSHETGAAIPSRCWLRPSSRPARSTMRARRTS